MKTIRQLIFNPFSNTIHSFPFKINSKIVKTFFNIKDGLVSFFIEEDVKTNQYINKNFIIVFSNSFFEEGKYIYKFIDSFVYDKEYSVDTFLQPDGNGMYVERLFNSFKELTTSSMVFYHIYEIVEVQSEFDF